MFDVAGDIPRAKALAEILCGAAHADDELDPDEADQIRAELRGLLGVTDVHPDVDKHVRMFSRSRFDLIDALTRLRLSDLAHKKALMRSVRSVLKADAIMRETERDYFARLAHTLRLAPADID